MDNLNKYHCKSCGKDYQHRKRYISHLLNTSCGEAYERFGWDIDEIDGRTFNLTPLKKEGQKIARKKPKVKKPPVRADEEPDAEEENVEIVEQVDVETVSEDEPKPKPKPKPKPRSQCAGCGASIPVRANPCPQCGIELEWMTT